VLGDLVMNPGGPGASGITFLEQASSSFPSSLRAEFNLVSFDPRGVGVSDPVDCADAAQTRSLVAADPAPTTDSEIDQLVSESKAFIAECEARTTRPLLDNVGTAATIEDLDRIRAALGEAKLNYLGFSYGTYIGELYAQAYPTHVRTMVLDGPIDPALSVTASEMQQASGFELDLKDFFNWCATDKTCTGELPGGAAVDYNRFIDGLRAGHTVTAVLQQKFGGTISVGLGVAVTAVIASLYSSSTWPQLAQAIHAGIAGNGVLLAELAYSYEGLLPSGQFANILSANTAISCEDDRVPATIAAYKALAALLTKTAPNFGALEAWSTIACSYWPVRAQRVPAPVAAKGTPPILVIGSTGDPATPYAGAVAVAGQLSRGVLLTRSGPGHTGYLLSSCIRSWTDRYIESLQLPPPHTVCPTG
jgi:pimeloyl-ACP methyl ester carboxylesterase